MRLPDASRLPGLQDKFSQLEKAQRRQVLTATVEGQTVFTITNGSYVVGSETLRVTVGGITQPPDAYTETNSTTVTLSEGVPVGKKVMLEWLEGKLPVAFGHNTSHYSDGQDPIDVTKLKNYDKIVQNLRDNDEMILVSAFNGLNGTTLDLYLSYNGKDLLSLNFSNVFTPTSGYLRDPSLMYKNGYFYVAYTTNLQNVGLPNKGFGVARSRNLKDWEQFYIQVPSNYTICWAPEWFVLGNDVYINLSLSTGTTEADIDGVTIPYLKQYYMKATNADFTAFGTPVEHVYSSVSNKIDSFMIEKSGTLYCFVKNEYNKKIELYTKTSFETGTWNFSRDYDFGIPVEGPAVVYFKGLYYLYADGFSTNTTMCMTSPDLVTWSAPFVVGSPSDVRTQHFSATNVVSDMLPSLDGVLRRGLLEQLNFKKNTKGTSLRRYPIEKALSGTTLKPYGFNTYYVSNGVSPTNVVIDNIQVSDYTEDMKLYFCLQVPSTNTTHSITIKNANNILTPGNKDFVISSERGNNEMIVLLECIGTNDPKFRIVNNPDPRASKTYDVPLSRVDLTPLAVGGVISSLAVKDGYYYVVTGTNAVTINDFDVTNVSGIKANVYFCVESGSTGASITFKKGSKLLTPGGVDFVLSVANSKNDMIYEFRKPFTTYSQFRLMGN